MIAEEAIDADPLVDEPSSLPIALKEGVIGVVGKSRYGTGFRFCRGLTVSNCFLDCDESSCQSVESRLECLFCSVLIIRRAEEELVAEDRADIFADSPECGLELVDENC